MVYACMDVRVQLLELLELLGGRAKVRRKGQASSDRRCVGGQPPTHNDEHTVGAGGGGGKSVVVSSNLRRCIETAALALWPRFQSASTQMVILSGKRATEYAAAD